MQYSPYYLSFLEIWSKRANGSTNVMKSFIFIDTYILKRMREIYFWFSEQCLLLSVATHMHVCFSNIRKFNFSYYINYCLYVVSVSDVVWVIWKTRVCKTNLFKRRSSLSGRLNLANSALSQVEMSSTFSLIWSQCWVSASRRLPPPLCQILWMFLGRGMWPVVGWLKRKDCMNCWLESEALCIWDSFPRTRCMRLTTLACNYLNFRTSQKHDFETSIAYSASDSEHGRKVLWPANQTRVERHTVDASGNFSECFEAVSDHVDRPHRWLHVGEHDSTEKGGTIWNGTAGCSQDGSIRQQVRERCGEGTIVWESCCRNKRKLWTCQSPGGVAGGHGSPSGNRGQVEEMWMN